MMYKSAPADFKPRYKVVSCFCEYKNQLLLLKRQDGKPQSNTWGAPAGKVEENERYEDAIIREMREETGLVLIEKDLVYLDTVFVRFPEYDFEYIMFKYAFEDFPDIVLDSKAHKEYAWKTPQEALNMDLIQDLDSCLKLFY